MHRLDGGSGCFRRREETQLNKNVIIQTIKNPSGGDKQEKYGRYLGVIWLDGVNVNELLIMKGYAVRWED